MTISLNRPIAASPVYHDIRSVAPFIRKMVNAGVDFKSSAIMICTTQKNSWKPSILTIVGHDEYWSQKMRQNMDEFVRRGMHSHFWKCWLGAIDVEEEKFTSTRLTLMTRQKVI